jgi:hypothetical protein
LASGPGTDARTQTRPQAARGAATAGAPAQACARAGRGPEHGGVRGSRRARALGAGASSGRQAAHGWRGGACEPQQAGERAQEASGRTATGASAAEQERPERAA